MKLLYVTTIGLTMIFFKDLVKELIDDGNTVDIATNESDSKVDDFYRELGCNIYQVDFSRSPLDKGNMKAYKQLKKVVAENKYDIVHCHTPVAGAVTRLACKKLRKKGLRVFYTAHGFHFYKGAPKKNWIIYYPVEKYCSRYTDTLITINQEDYELEKARMKAKHIEYVPGVGIDVDKFANTVVDRAAKRKELGIPEYAFLLLSVGELNENKNHQVVIRALAELNNPEVHYMIAGEGPLKEYLEKLAEDLKVKEQVHLLGYRDDVAELYKTADANVFPSIREGLGLASLEGMAAGLPLICADNRGTREYMLSEEVGIACNSESKEDFTNAIKKVFSGKEDFGKRNEEIAKRFSVKRIVEQMYSFYSR